LGAQVGERAQDFLWRAVSSLEDVEIEVRFSGSVRGPSLSIGSNVGRAVAQSLRQELGREIARAEQQVRAEIDRLVSNQVNEASGRVEALQTDLESRIGGQLGDLTAVREELERAIRRLVPGA
jgi:ABC-type phosphate transport system auxiliary subunit